jgi:hypothetical protein
MGDFTEWDVIQILSGVDLSEARASLQQPQSLPWEQNPLWDDAKWRGSAAYDHNRLPAQIMEKAFIEECFGVLPTEQETLELKKAYGRVPVEEAEAGEAEFDEDDLLARLQPAIKRIVRQVSAAAVKSTNTPPQKRAPQQALDPYFDRDRKVLSVEDKPCPNGVVRHTKFVGGERMEFIETA